MKKILLFIKWFFLLVPVSLVLFALFANYYIPRSEPYLVIEKEIRVSNEIRSKIGLIKDIKVSPWGGFSEEHSGPNGRASLEILVKGEKREVIVFAELETVLGQWKIKGMRVDD
jgi:hypothetical protein